MSHVSVASQLSEGHRRHGASSQPSPMSAKRAQAGTLRDQH
jgi:hypothetical protein